MLDTYQGKNAEVKGLPSACKHEHDQQTQDQPLHHRVRILLKPSFCLLHLDEHNYCCIRAHETALLAAAIFLHLPLKDQTIEEGKKKAGKLRT